MTLMKATYLTLLILLSLSFSTSYAQNKKSWQWQLQGKINTSYDVDIYDIDLFDSSPELIKSLQEQGRQVICYFSAGSYENWREDRETFPPSSIGKTMHNWKNERWLDISNIELQEVMKKRLDLAVKKGCDGVEPDNVDGYLHKTGFKLYSKDQLKYNKFLAKEAHKRSLLIGLKNDMRQIKKLEPYFDFAVNEQCYKYKECKRLKPFIKANKPVLHVEYSKKYRTNSHAREKLCSYTSDLNLSTLILSVKLNDAFRYSCD